MQKKTRQFRLNEYLQNSKNRSYFTIFASLIFVIIMVTMGILPAYSAFTLQAQENIVRNQVKTQLQNKLSALEGIDKDLEEKFEMVELFEDSMPLQANQDQVIDQITTLMGKNNLDIDLLTFSFPRRDDLNRRFFTDENVKNQLVNLSVTGKLRDIQNFLVEIENSKRIYNILSMTIARLNESETLIVNPEDTHSLSLTIEIYYYSKPSP